MEMTNRRWVALVVLCCAAVVTFRLPPMQRARWLDWEQRARKVSQATIAANLNQRLMDLDEAATIIARRDSLLAASRGNPDRSIPLVVVSENVRDPVAHLVEGLVRADHQALGKGGRSHVVSVVADRAGSTPKRINYLSERQFILPSATDGETCITIVRLGRGAQAMNSLNRPGIMGPCVFQTAFGPPGPGVEAWLRRRNYDVSFDAAWPTGKAGNPDVLAPRVTTMQADLERWLDFNRSFRYLNLTACASGDADACAKLVRTTPVRYPVTLPPGVVTQRRNWEWFSPLGPATSNFLADLLAEQGSEKFARFWRSPAEMEVAFKSAFGESTGEWTMRWMRYRYGADNRGPYISPRSALLSVLASVSLVGLCAAAATRRQAE